MPRSWPYLVLFMFVLVLVNIVINRRDILSLRADVALLMDHLEINQDDIILDIDEAIPIMGRDTLPTP